MKAVLKYPGAKNRIADWICSHIPPHDVYLEPFAGSLAVLLNKPRCHIETVNDLDGEIVNFFQVLRDYPEQLKKKIDWTPFARDEYRLAFEPTEDVIERARRYCVRCWQGFGNSQLYNNGFKTGQQTRSPNPAMAWAELPETLLLAAERLKGVQIENLPALELMRRYDTRDVFIYMDPSYLPETRKGYLYKHEMTRADHEELLKAAVDHPGKILISGYDNEMYNDYLSGWRKAYKDTAAECGLKRQEVLWMNYRDNLIIDCFAGGGGASVGIEMALGRPVDIAINHDPDAILMHKTNHPDTLHLTEDIFKVDLPKYVKGRKVSLMWASPDCTSHSKAKGGKPREKGLRILPWAVYKHAKTILPDVIIMENVEEIQQWGPLDAEGHPIPERKGEDYKRFITAMKSLGYIFDSRELVAADYGAPTTRKRWYAVFRRDGKDIVWPEPTHSKDGRNGMQKWLECGDYIDWSDLGKSIFDRQKPLANATMKRIANGYVKYVVNNPKPYIVRNKEAVAFLIQYHGEQKEGEARGQLLTEPIKTIDTSNRYGLVTAFITKFYKSGIGQGCDEPLHTITTSPGHFGLISAFLIKYYGTGCGQELSLPLGTITTKDRFGLVNVIVDIDGEKYIMKDIFLRMLKPEELKLMQGFLEDYIIDRDYMGRKYSVSKQVARIGNSVVPIMAQKLVEANCDYLKIGERMPNMRIDDSGYQLRFA